MAWLLSFFVGFLSLSQEILWVRLLGFALGGRPLAFTFVLTMYLIGIALGAEIGKWLCAKRQNLWAVASVVLAIAAATDPLPPLFGPLMDYGNRSAPSAALLVLPGLAIVLTACIKSVLFPIAHHLGSNQVGPKGRGVSVKNLLWQRARLDPRPVSDRLSAA